MRNITDICLISPAGLPLPQYWRVYVLFNRAHAVHCNPLARLPCFMRMLVPCAVAPVVTVMLQASAKIGTVDKCEYLVNVTQCLPRIYGAATSHLPAHPDENTHHPNSISTLHLEKKTAPNGPNFNILRLLFLQFTPSACRMHLCHGGEI